jgi:acyl-ACP thioesterase
MYTLQSRVRYSEVTKDLNMDLYSILNYFQDCSNFQSADLGVGVEYLMGCGRVWLLSAWQVTLIEPPRLFDRITVGTWPYAFKGMYGYRNFILYNESSGHKPSAIANSIWFLADIKTKKPLRITPEDAAPYVLEPAYPMEYAPRKITVPEKSKMDNFGNSIFSCSPAPVTVTKMLLDTNCHVNNGQYVRIAQSCLPDSFKVCGMRAEYRRAALLDDVICPSLTFSDNRAHCFVSLNDTCGHPYAVVEFTAAV